MVESKAWVNSHFGSYIQLRNGEPSQGWDKKDKGTVARVWPSGWCKCFLLVSEPQIKEQTQASPSPKLREPESWNSTKTLSSSFSEKSSSKRTNTNQDLFSDSQLVFHASNTTTCCCCHTNWTFLLPSATSWAGNNT